MDTRIAALAREIEASLALTEDLARRTLDQIRALEGGQGFAIADLESTDRILALICAERPGWSLSAKGIAQQPNGHWRCTLRQSAARDNDEYLGVGHGPTLPHAMLAALFKVLALAS